MRNTLLTSLGLVLLLHSALAAAPEWRLGLASVKITPTHPLRLAGYASRVKPFEKVDQELYAKALVLEDREGGRALLLTADLIGLSAAVAEPICERIAQQTGLKREQILLNCSHTHSGPALSLKADANTGAEQGAATVAYTRALQDQLVELAVRAAAQLEPARLSWGSGLAHFAVNRREFTARGVILGINPRGLVDRTVPVLRVEGGEGRLRAVVFGYACHNTTLSHTNLTVCGDYAGFAQEHLQGRWPEALALFLTGCGGDANPYPRGTLELAREHGQALGREVSRVLETPLQPLSGPLRTVLGYAELPLQAPSLEELKRLAVSGASWQTGNAKTMLARVERGEALATTYRAPLAVWQFGSSLTLVGLSGEVVVDYVSLLEQALGPLQLWVAAYCNDYFGYLPSARLLREGGYETRGLFNGEGWFAPGAEPLVVETVRGLARQAGRKLPE